MPPTILGLHHVTATVNDAQADLDFCLDRLGLRLVKKTVNFDNHHVYHFYYGDERGTPGTIWTTFPYKGHGVPAGTIGAGQVTATSFSVPASSLDDWQARLTAAGLAPTGGDLRFEERTLTMRDPSGLVIELVGTDRDTRAPWAGGGVDTSAAIRGLHSVTMTIAAPAPTVSFMETHLGWVVTGHDGARIRLTAGGDGPGKTIDILHAPSAPRAKNGLGTVHHVAMAIGTADEQIALREALLTAGVGVTEVRDRQYFTSIYFREPGGVLFEVATIEPGFTVDEPLDALGRDLKLPPWEEPARATISTGLSPIRYRA